MTRKAKFLTGFWAACCLGAACGSAQAVIPVLAPALTTLFTTLLPPILFALGGLILTLFKPATMRAIVKVLWHQKIVVVVVIAGVVGLVYLWGAISSAWEPGVGGFEASSDTYAMFRGNAARQGVSGNAADPVAGNVNWAYTKDVRTFYSTPAVVGNRVYITSADKGLYTDRGAIYCLDADTGGVVWKSAPRGYRATFSSPAVSGKYLVVGEGLHFTTDARIMCLDTTNGALLWEFRTKSHVESSPCIYKDRAYVGSGNDGYYCFELEPGPGATAKMVWHAPTERCPDAETPPVAVDGKVYVGLGMEGRGVACLDADTGAQVWRQATPCPVFTPPTVVNGKVIVGMGIANYIETEEEVRDKELKKLRDAGKSKEEIARAQERLKVGGEVWCLDAATGKVEWRFHAGRSVLGAVAAQGERLYFGSRDGRLYCISLAGKEIAKWDAHAPILGSPAVTRDHVYVVTQNGILYCLGADDLVPVWEVTLGTTGRFLSSPTVARGRVYVGSETQGLLCVGVPATMKKEPVWAGLMGGPGSPGQVDGSALPDKGVFAWRYPPRSEEDNATVEKVSVTGPCASLVDKLFVPTASASRQGLACLLNDPKGRETPAEKWFFKTPNPVSVSPAAVGARVFLVDGKRGDANRFLHCVDVEKGTEQWKAAVASEASGEFLLEKDCLLIQPQADVLARLGLDGKEEWRERTGAIQGCVVSAGPILLAATENPPTLIAMDSLTGKELWRTALPARPTTSPAVRERTVFIGTTEGMAALSLIDGKPLWKGPAGEVRGTFLLDAGVIAYVNSASELVVLDFKGQPVGKPVEALAAIPPVASRGTILFASKTGLMRYEPSLGEPALWMRTAWLGELTLPMVMANSQVYFATDNGGLICAKGRAER
jgi:outer membrane protein assembly factor BamB